MKIIEIHRKGRIIMRKKLAKALLRALIIMILATSAVPAYAEVDPTDIENHWGEANIKFLIDKGAISGYPDGTFKPNNTISKAEFLSIAVKAANGGTTSKSPQGAHWASGVFQDALRNDVLKSNEMPESTWNQPITRYEMTLVMVRITENMLKEAKSSTTGVAKIMADYQKVQQQPQYKYYVEQAFMKGIVTGMDKQGTFAGERTGTRAEAATMVMRILDVSKRSKVDVDKVIEAPVGQGEVSLKDPSRTVVPQAGMVVVKPDGSKVTLKVHEGSGVLGHGQGVDYYSGITFANGNVFKEGSLGTPSMGYRHQTYLVCEKTGEGHFVADWNKIGNYEIEQARKAHPNPTNGQKYGEWVVYDYGMWTWNGPINM